MLMIEFDSFTFPIGPELQTGILAEVSNQPVTYTYKELPEAAAPEGNIGHRLFLYCVEIDFLHV